MTSFKEIKEGLYRYQEVSGGHVALISDAASLIKAAEKVRDRGVKEFDCFTPFPIHGIEKAMGLSRSWIPFWSLIGGLTGLTFGFTAMTYIDVVDWSNVFGGKPIWSWPAYVPILFELTVLFAAFFTVGSVFYLGRLGKSARRPVANNLTSDGFAIWIGDKDVSKQEIETLLSGLAVEVKEVPVEN